MDRTSAWRALLLTAALLTPGVAAAQGLDYAPPDVALPLPLATTQPGLGGLFLYADFAYFEQTNPLRQQEVAVRGFVDVDGSVTGRKPGTFVGSGQDALDVNSVRGPRTFEPGFRVGIGWKFADGSALTFDYLYVAIARYSAAATLIPQNFNVGNNLENSFLTAFVYNFPNEYAGPAFKTNQTSPFTNGPVNPFAVYGIWNGASIMTEEFLQRFENYDITYRVPVYETETYRLSGIVGPRYAWLWERYRWRTTDIDTFLVNGVPADIQVPQNAALFSNITNNQMYGVFIGCENEWYVGHGFAWYINLDAAFLVDHVEERDQYELGTKFLVPQNKRAKLDYTFVPELEGKIGLAWYPAEGIQLRIDYNAMVFFNTVASPQPVSFNYGALDPIWSRATRLLDGFTAGIALTF